MSNLEHWQARFAAYLATLPDGAPARLFCLKLNPESRGSVGRYSFMFINCEGQLEPLWGGFDADAPTAAERKAWLPGMIYLPRPANGNDRFPAFHFVARGYGFDKQHEIAAGIARRIGRAVEWQEVNGWQGHFRRAEAE